MRNQKYKIYILIIKFAPIIFAFIYFINTILFYLKIYIPIISWFAFVPFSVLFILYISSILFKFCIWHRLPLYYILFCDIANLLTLEYSILPSIWLGWHFIIFGGLIILGAYLKNKYNEQTKSSKNDVA